MHANRILSLTLLILFGTFVQARADTTYVFATIEQGRTAITTRDDYLKLSTPLEWQAVMHKATPVDEQAYLRYLRGEVKLWMDSEQAELKPMLERLTTYIAGIHAKAPAQILLVKVGADLYDGSPYTRGNAIFITENWLKPDKFRELLYLLPHETFHVLSRSDPVMREKVYGAIGFRRCASIQVPEAVNTLRIINPDGPVNDHSIAVTYQGKPVEIMPYIRFKDANADTKIGLMSNLKVNWLLVTRNGNACMASEPATEILDREVGGLYEQIGRNTQYVMHPDEILADNFALMFMAYLAPKKVTPPSPEVLDRINSVLFK